MGLVALFLGLLIGWFVGRSMAPRAPDVPPAPVPVPPPADPLPPLAPPEPVAVAQPTPAPAPPPEPPEPPDESEPLPEDPQSRAYALAKALVPFCDDANHGRELAQHPDFPALVALLAAAPFTTRDRLDLVPSSSTPMSCAAIAALTAAGDDGRLDVARTVGRFGYMALHFALLHLASADDPHVAGEMLSRAKTWWAEHPPTRAGLVAYLDAQRARGVVPALDPAAEPVDAEDQGDTLKLIRHPLATDFIAVLERAEQARRGSKELGAIGRVLRGDTPDLEPAAVTPAWRARVEALMATLDRKGRPSVVVTGPAGAGKSALIRHVLHDYVRRGYTVLEATAAQVAAGQKYIGELEGRLENVVRALSGGTGVWYVPDCHTLLEKGSWSGDPHGLLDMLLPHLEQRRIQVIGESTTESWSRVLTARPRAASVLPAFRVDAFSDADARDLGRAWADSWSARLGARAVDGDVLDETLELARMHFPEAAEPGRSIGLLDAALEDARAEKRADDAPALPLTREAILRALSRRSGLPLDVLDVERPLDLAAVRGFFTDRVIGQDEAVDCLVDRVGMLKAGLTDPRRPIGVFLFAGPTGTGKTEIAKTLAERLFGSADRMLRVDMSEYQSDDAYWRLIDDGQHGRTASLATRIRQNPFAVVLLDEFEKASPRVWDLFLQVFDDGRLTDRAGNTADFRHSIIVLTSNLGAGGSSRGGPGFLSTAGGWSRSQVERAIADTFRPEFVNRLDRVVIFNPLTRAVMRDILQKELRRVLERRGFRIRDWAVEWEPSAVDFLLERGFTVDLGARPLRRAIDRYLLAPLSRTIVEHRAPSGEQFLFVTSDGRDLDVRFVDPDAPSPVPPAHAPAHGGDLRALALDPRLDDDVPPLLARAIDALAARLADDAWARLKDEAAAAMQQPDFWQKPARRAVLDRLERMDRVEEGLRAVRSLHGRIARGRGRGAVDLVRRLALQVRMLDVAAAALVAGEPEDAWLELRATEPASADALAWRDRLHAMYSGWAQARGLRVTDAAAGGAARSLLVSGPGAWSVLRDEAGLHVLESGGADGGARHGIRVRVASEPPARDAAPPATEADQRVRRRYDDGPAPLVRDAVGGWRSGRLDRVLAGDFDLFA